MLKIVVASAAAPTSAAAPAIARRLSEFSALYADSCANALEQMEAIQPASNPLFDGGCKMSAESFEPSTYATLLPECTFDYSAFAGVTTCTAFYAAYGAFCSQIAACGDVVVSEDPGSGEPSPPPPSPSPPPPTPPPPPPPPSPSPPPPNPPPPSPPPACYPLCGRCLIELEKGSPECPAQLTWESSDPTHALPSCRQPVAPGEYCEGGSCDDPSLPFHLSANSVNNCPDTGGGGHNHDVFRVPGGDPSPPPPPLAAAAAAARLRRRLG